MAFGDCFGRLQIGNRTGDFENFFDPSLAEIVAANRTLQYPLALRLKNAKPFR